MEETNNDDSLTLSSKKDKFSSSIYSIIENQEENNTHSINNSNLDNNLDNDDNKKSKDEIEKNIIHSPKIRNSNNKNKKKSLKNSNKLIRYKNNICISINSVDEKSKKNLLKESKKDNKNFEKKITFPQTYIYGEENSSSKNIKLSIPFQILNRINYKRTGTQNYSGINNINNNKLMSVFNHKYASTNSLNRNSKSFNILNSNSLIKFHSNKKIKKEKFHNHKLLSDNDIIVSNDLFDKIKNNPLIEKLEKILKEQKIFYGLIALCIFLSILFKVTDNFIYNKKSLEYLENDENKSILLQSKILYYKLIEKRKISEEENQLRVLNIISSLISSFLVFKIHFNKKKFMKQIDKRNLELLNYNNYYGYRKRKKNLKGLKSFKIMSNNDGLTKNKLLAKKDIIEIIINCIINLIFYPPYINKVFIIKNRNIIHVYSLNSIFLIFTFFKLINFYQAILRLSPINNTIYMAIFRSRMIKIDFLFLLRYFLNRYPMTFILFNLLIIGITFCILVFCLEFFSFEISNNVSNNNDDNNLRKIYNIIYLLVFYFTKNIFGEIVPNSFLGKLILIIGGSCGAFIFFYLIYYLNELIKLSSEEQKAYTKLNKILNPLNNEHKAANLIKVILQIKKISKDYKNIEIDYGIAKKQNLKIYKKFEKKKNNFNFIKKDNDTNRSFNKIEKKIFLDRNNFKNYIYNTFILKLKFIIECKNFKNNLLIARNFSNSFTDLLKTLRNKMDENLNQLNNKLQVLTKIEEKYKNFKEFHEKSLREIKKIIIFQKESLKYILKVHNLVNYKNYLMSKRPKLKSSISGPIINSNRQSMKKDSKNKHNYFDYNSYQNYSRYKRLKSSFHKKSKISNFEKVIKKKIEVIPEILDKNVPKRKIHKSKTLRNNSNNIKSLTNIEIENGNTIKRNSSFNNYKKKEELINILKNEDK